MCFQRDSTHDSRKQRAAEKVQLTIQLVYDNLHKIQFNLTKKQDSGENINAIWAQTNNPILSEASNIYGHVRVVTCSV